MSNKGLLTVISGFSGAGKGTIVKELVEKHDYVVSISATTRKPRENEKDGINYFFLSEDEFKKTLNEDGFIEHASFVGNYYGTPRKYVEKILSEGKNVILEIEVQGGLQVKKQYPDAVMIFISPPDAVELRNRLIGRGTEDESTINKRLERAAQETDYIKEYDYFVINDDLKECVNNIHAILTNEKKKIIYNQDFIEKFNDNFINQLLL